MKKLMTWGAIAIFLSLTQTEVYSQAISIPFGHSPSATISQTIGVTNIAVSYSRPRVINGDQDDTGKIWGNRVHYGFKQIGFGYQQEIPWTAGANRNTTIAFEHDVKINGNELEAGTYGFYMAVYEDGNVTLIFSNNANSWESFWYHPDKDVLRVDTQMEEYDFTNSLTYSFDKITDTSCELALTWEKKRIAFTIDVNVHEIALASFEEDLKGTVGFGSEAPAAAAQYLLEEDVYLEQALIYAQWAVNNGPSVPNKILKASILIKTGKEEESEVLLQDIVAEANVWQMYFLTQDLISFQKPRKALDLMKSAMKKNGHEALAHLALGKAYLANQQWDQAIKSAKKALSLEPNDYIKSNTERLITDSKSGKK